MAITVFDAVGKFSADTSQLDQFIVKLEQGLTSASDKAAASTRELKAAQDEFRAAIKAVNTEGGATAENMNRLAEAEKNLVLAAQAAKVEHQALKNSLGQAKEGAEKAGGSMMEARHSVMILGEELGIKIPRAVASMIASFGPLTGLLTIAFPILGVLALLAAIGKAIELQEKHAAAMRKAAQDAENLTIKEEDRTAAIEAQNLKLEDSIRKLEGRPETNQLAIALLEVKTKADELATSFAKDFASMDKDVQDLNGFIQKGSDYLANFFKAYEGGFGVVSMLIYAKQILEDRGKETDAVKNVQKAEQDLEKARLASHEAATLDAGAQQVALGQQATAAGNLQKAYDTLADAITKVDPNNHELIAKLRLASKSAEADWKDLGAEITQIGLTVKKTSDEIAAEMNKRAEDKDKIRLTGQEQLGILDADKIKQAGEVAFTAEQAAISRLVDAEVQAGKERLQAELDLIPRMEQAEIDLNQAKLSALERAHQAKMTMLEGEQADILKYEKGDVQQKALQENLNKQKEEQAKFELDRQKLEEDGQQKLLTLDQKGENDRLALQKAMQQATLELSKANTALIAAQAKLSQDAQSQGFKEQEQAINRLASMQVITEQEKAKRLIELYKLEEEAAVASLRKQQEEIAVEAAKGIKFFGPEQLAELKSNLKLAEGDFQASIAVIKAAFAKIQEANPFLTPAQVAQLQAELDRILTEFTKTQATITTTQASFNDKRLALDKSYYGESLALAIASGRQLLAQQLQEVHADLLAAQGQRALMQARKENTDGIDKQIAALQKLEKQMEKNAHEDQQGTNSLKKFLDEVQKGGGLSKVFDEDMASSSQAMQNFGAVSSFAFDEFAGAMENAFQQAILGEASLGEAMAKGTAEVLAQIAARAIVWGMFYTAQGIADIFWNPARAGADFASAAEFFAIGAAAAVTARAINPGSGSSGGGSPSVTPTQTGSPATTAQPNPTQVENVQSFATGTVALGPTLAMIGDSETGGAQAEAVIPLENQRALDLIAMALVPAIVRGIAGRSGIPPAPADIPSMAGGGVALGPLLAMIGDSETGGSAREGVLPLENSSVMDMISEALAPGIGKALASFLNDRTPAAQAAGPALSLPSPSLISPATLASVNSLVEHEIRVEQTEERRTSAASNIDPQRVASALAKAMDGKTPLSGKIEIELQSDIDQVVKKINHNVSTGRSRLEATTAHRTIKRT